MARVITFSASNQVSDVDDGQPAQYRRFTKSDFAKAIAGVVGAANFVTCWGNAKFQIYMSLCDSFGKDDAETTAVLDGAVASGGMSAGQRTGILNQWPTA